MVEKIGNKFVDDAINEIDAAMFSGDVFDRAEEAQKFQLWLQRWERALLGKFLVPAEQLGRRR